MKNQAPDDISIFSSVDDAAEERALAEAEAQIAAGQIISHEAMRR